MYSFQWLSWLGVVGGLWFGAMTCAQAPSLDENQSQVQTERFPSEHKIPEILNQWRDWVLWENDPIGIPKLFNDAQSAIVVWPSALQLSVTGSSATWQLNVEVFRTAWVALPGDEESWPTNVRGDSQMPSNGAEGTKTLVDMPLVVLPRNGVPSVRLEPGRYSLSGEFRWVETPQKVLLPRTIGVVSLVLDGADVPLPNWDSNGYLWLSRPETEEAEQNRMSIKVYRYLEDGIPIWLHSRIELTVSGRSREEDLKNVLPEGWILSQVESSIPVAIDEQGKAKAQVRPGNWTISFDAFRTLPLTDFKYAEGTVPCVDTELIGLKTSPTFRLLEFAGLPTVDVQQTTYPEDWRNLPVFQWNVSQTFRLVEKMRGMGTQKPQGLSVVRHFWLDDDGNGITYEDNITGSLQQNWRLDSAEAHTLGAVRINGERQLITANPASGESGVEVRSRNPRLNALGRIERTQAIPVTGWKADVDSLQVDFSLPPGWRVWAVLGADRVEGDWLTAWTLMDLFLLLIFALSVYRLCGIPAGLLALLAMGLAYHEPDSPRWTWLCLLIPLALLKVIHAGTSRNLIQLWRGIAVAVLLINLVPFVARQIQFVIYPQLEAPDSHYGDRSTWFWGQQRWEAEYETNSAYVVDSVVDSVPSEAFGLPSSSAATSKAAPQIAAQQAENLMFDPSERTQTGPALPKWSGNMIRCRWDGPVASDQTLRPIYLPRSLHRLIAIIRCISLLALLGLLLNSDRLLSKGGERKGILAKLVLGACFILGILGSDSVQAQIPDQEILKELRERLLSPSESFPQAADIHSLELTVEKNVLRMRMEIHASESVAVPVPGKFPAWSPRTIKWDAGTPSTASSLDSSATAVRSEDGTLWLLVPEGVHSVVVEGIIAESNEWVLGFNLTPRAVKVTAPEWQVVGLQDNRVPGNQLFFSRLDRGSEQEAKYDQRNFRPLVLVERRIELGLLWKVSTRVLRLSSPGKAISVQVPLLADERVVSSTQDRTDRMIEVNLEPEQTSYSWESEMPHGNALTLEAASTDQFVERWVLLGSPVWNVAFDGVQPVYEVEQSDLSPVWQVWPGEKVTINVKRPVAIEGETLTVQQVGRTISLGSRQKTTLLNLDVEASLGGEFQVQLNPDSEVTSLMINSRAQPVRYSSGVVTLTLEPGLQKIELAMEADESLGYRAGVGEMVLPIEAANVDTELIVPTNRWILWANGPLRGPAVRLWIFIASALLLALALGLQKNSPLPTYEWLLLSLGLTQLHAMFGLIVVGWLFALAYRDKQDPNTMKAWKFNFLQFGLVILTFIALSVLVAAVGKGLLGQPEMFILGNGSSNNQLRWFEPHSPNKLSQPWVISISIWYYRLFMLLWALWLASALLRWLIRGWESFSKGGRIRFGKVVTVKS